MAVDLIITMDAVTNNKLIMLNALNYYTKEEAVFILIIVIKIRQELMAMIGVANQHTSSV